MWRAGWRKMGISVKVEKSYRSTLVYNLGSGSGSMYVCMHHLIADHCHVAPGIASVSVAKVNYVLLVLSLSHLRNKEELDSWLCVFLY